MRTLGFLGILICMNGVQDKNDMGKIVVDRLTQTGIGHMLHHHGVFSEDGLWVVFDGRNDDTKIGETSIIGVVNTETGEEHIIYRTTDPSVHGPGVGAASFSPVDDCVIFIHGLSNANEEHPYDMSRRTGMSVDINRPGHAVPADARDMTAPYAPGSLRGGTHSHCWSPDGAMLSFTYNDELVEPGLRMVGVMFKRKEQIEIDPTPGNVLGHYYSAIVSEVVTHPRPGSDEIDKAYDECWLNPNLDTKAGRRTIAFQGNIKNEKGESVTEIFLVDIDPQLIEGDKYAVGEKGKRPQVPKGIEQRRLTFSVKGLSNLRHWLRSSEDGRYIYALAKDKDNNNQLVQCAVKDGTLTYLSNFEFSIASPINISHKGDKVTFVANNNVYLFDIASKVVSQLTTYGLDDDRIVGAPVFSRQDDKIAFNQYEGIGDNKNIQIRIIAL